MRISSIVIPLLTLWLAVACGSSGSDQPARAPEPRSASSVPEPVSAASPRADRIRVAYSAPSGSQLVTYIAHEAGFFRKHGLEVDLELVGGALTVPTIVSGEFQFAQTGTEQIASAYLQGSELVILATMVPTLQMTLVGIPNVKTASDLKGKRVGITGFGSIGHKAARLALERLGLEPERDVTFIQVRDNPTLRGALLGGTVEAGSMGRTNALPLVRDGMNMLMDFSKEGLEYPASNYFTSRPFAQANKDIVLRFLKAILESLKLYLTDKEQAVTMFQRFAQLDSREAAEEAVSSSLLYLRRIPVTSAPGVQLVLDFMAEDNPQVKSVQPESLLDMSYLRELDSSGFLRQLWGN